MDFLQVYFTQMFTPFTFWLGLGEFKIVIIDVTGSDKSLSVLLQILPRYRNELTEDDFGEAFIAMDAFKVWVPTQKNVLREKFLPFVCPEQCSITFSQKVSNHIVFSEIRMTSNE